MLLLCVEPVPGRSCGRAGSTLDRRNALKSGGRGGVKVGSPNEAELKVTYFANVLAGALQLKMEGLSDENASKGYASIACAGGPIGTPNRVWCGAASCKRDRSFRRCCRGSRIGSAVL